MSFTGSGVSRLSGAPVAPPASMTGAPLFSQLSPAAASSVVGAFSLRAINGVTAKAVAVQAHPVAQWPPIAMTSNTFTATGTFNGVLNGVYTASSSNGFASINQAEFKAFDNDPTTYYEENYPTGQSYNNAGNLINPTFTQTTVSGDIVQGEWLQLKLPTNVNVTLRRYTFAPRSGLEYRCPRIFWIAGSPDGATWSNVHFQTGITGYTYPTGITFTIPQTSNSIPYNYYRVIVNAIVGGAGGGNGPMNIAAWNLYGDSPSYATGSATDFYADSLGNLLTAPVTGQLLQNWLGSSIGYVTTWYDQSGAGNDTIQGTGTVANQPTIVNSSTGNGYVPQFTSPVSNKFFTMNTNLNLGAIDGSYTKSVWTYVTSNVSQFQNFLATSTAPGTGTGYHGMGWSFGTGGNVPYFTAFQNTYSINLPSTTFPLNTWTHLAVTYNNPTQTFLMYKNGVQVYSNTVFTASFNAGDGLIANRFRIGVGYGNSCNSQNYDVAIFNSALSASDITTLYNSRLY